MVDPIPQRVEDKIRNTTGDVTAFAAGSGTASKSDSTWDGDVGSTGYTVGDIVSILKKRGFLAV